MKVKQKFWLSIVLLLFMPFARAGKADPQLFIIDSWMSGFIHGLVKSKEQRWKTAWNKAGSQAKNDMRIWGGLFVTDTNLTRGKRFGELVSRHTYQFPQTGIGFTVAQFYNTVLCKVNTVSYANGSSVLNMNVNWTGICFGNYILAKKTITAIPDNRIFQHEYGHYLQSKRMGFAYLIRVGIPAIMSKGDHDAHPVEVDCNREAFVYFNRIDSTFQHDSLLYDKQGWNFLYNPFPDSVSQKVQYRRFSCRYIDFRNPDQVSGLSRIKVRALWLDYAGWMLFPAPVLVGVLNAAQYNKANRTNLKPIVPKS